MQKLTLKTKIYISLWLILAIVFTIKSIFWLGICFFLIAGIQFVSTTKCYQKIKSKKWISVPVMVIAVLAIAISLRLFIFEIYKIPSGSMKNTLFKGDIILVNKLIIGPRLPRSPFEIPWVNIPFFINAENKKETKKTYWDYKRLQGWREVERGDILVFNPPFNNQQTWIKRCVGLPGDTIYVDNHEVFINGKPSDPSNQEIVTYRLYFNNPSLLKNTLLSSGINTPNNFLNDSVDIEISYLQLIQLGIKKSFHHYRNLKTDNGLQKNSFSKVWYSRYDKVLIPFKGLEVKLTPFNKKRYKNILTRGEGLKWDKKLKEYKKDGIVQTHHTFKYSYYFMMGDNRTATQDSRSFSAIPETKIIGKAPLVLFNNGEGNINQSFLDRMLLRLSL